MKKIGISRKSAETLKSSKLIQFLSANVRLYEFLIQTLYCRGVPRSVKIN